MLGLVTAREREEGEAVRDGLEAERESFGRPLWRAKMTKAVQKITLSPSPKPPYRPHLPSDLMADGILSDAQIESVIYAGEAFSEFFAGSWTVDANFDVVAAARDEAENAVRFRRGWFLGDGTGAGKGRQVAGILLDNWLKGRRRAVWISKSDKLIEDAQRDWSALGMERLLVTPLSRFRQGSAIRLSEGILFATYATLRTDDRGEKLSRVKQIVEWLDSDFDGVIVFDESHAMQNAVGGKGERGDPKLYEPFTDSEGNLCSRPVYRDGQPVESREAVARRDRLIEKLASLSPVPGALDQIVQRFGTEMVAEVTGRSRRVIRKGDRLVVENRAGSANLAETSAFMDDVKRILVFSDAGGTGRSYHAELSARNRRLRVHYLLEPGWKAHAAIQGLGRTNRTNQAQPPLFRPIATDVKAEKRFLSTIARRLDTLGAIARGQRQTGGQGLFRPDDNLESQYARDASRQVYTLLVRGKVEGCSLERFEDATGLKLTDANGLRDDLPPITTFLNRLLALTIDLQNVLFTAFEQLLTARIEGALASGTYDVGLETLRAESFVVTDRRTFYVHPGTGAETRLLTITQRQRNHPVSLDNALDRLSDHRAVLLINERSGRAAVQVPAASVMLDEGEIERRVRLIRPMEQHQVSLNMMAESHWVDADRERFAAAWLAKLADVPKFTESKIHVVAGLLLPIWKRFPNESTRVDRLQTDAGERIIGRKVSAAWVANVVSADAPTWSPDAAFAAVREGRTVLELAEGLQLRRVRVSIELSGFNDTMRDRLRAYGLFGEIISWKLRMFVPTDASGVAILTKVIDTYPVTRVSGREAA
ncbi:strawberry notch C-terminal domain-containing protein [Bradyrhizobium agreste]|uniref:strawberry notch C-terminal domain-containing protein n=1 Tax=Bradyrhizobium agreste TaxID=2751811 RepID=UPI0035D5F36C